MLKLLQDNFCSANGSFQGGQLSITRLVNGLSDVSFKEHFNQLCTMVKKSGFPDNRKFYINKDRPEDNIYNKDNAYVNLCPSIDLRVFARCYNMKEQVQECFANTKVYLITILYRYL